MIPRIDYVRTRRVTNQLVIGLAVLAAGCGQGAAEDRVRIRKSVELCRSDDGCRGKNAKVEKMRVLLQSGARPHWSPDSKSILFDRRGSDGYADVYMTDLSGNVSDVTSEKSGIGKKNNGNAVFHPSGDFVVFISEEEKHFLSRNKLMGDPGLGLYCNLWATDAKGSKFWQLTDIPIRRKMFEKTPVVATVNPHFNEDGSMLVWTERYDRGGNWGKWRVKGADFVVRGGSPKLENERVLFQPSTGNYVTAMGFLGSHRLLVAGNLEGQHEFGMDLYSLNIKSKRVKNLLSTPDLWEEGACISPDRKRIVFMSNRDSPYKLDQGNKNWASQLLEREYYMINSDGSGLERLTYFNDSSAKEYLGGRNMVAVCEFSPNGRYIAGTLGIDTGKRKKRALELKLVLLDLQ